MAKSIKGATLSDVGADAVPHSSIPASWVLAQTKIPLTPTEYRAAYVQIFADTVSDVATTTIPP